MQAIRKYFVTVFMILTTLLSVWAPTVVQAAEIREEPSGGAMIADAVIARPLLLATTAIGTAFYIVTLPFSLLGGNAMDAGEALVVDPARATFVRCLGCSVSGRQVEFDEDVSYEKNSYEAVDASNDHKRSSSSSDLLKSARFVFKPYLTTGYLYTRYDFGSRSGVNIGTASSHGYHATLGATIFEHSGGYLEGEAFFRKQGSFSGTATSNNVNVSYKGDFTATGYAFKFGVKSDDSRFYTKVGTSFGRMDMSVTSPAGTSNSEGNGTDALYGLGLEYELTKNFGVSTEYVYIKDIHSLAANVTLRL